MVEDEIKQTIKENSLINSNEKVVIGVSGGPDSMCLLNVLNKLKNEMQFEIVVAHINHMIRKEADLETEYVKRYCKKNNIEYFVKKVDVIQKAFKDKIGTEEAGRKVRYDFFEEVRRKTNANKYSKRTSRTGVN